MWTACLRASLSSLLFTAALGACTGAGESEALPRADRPMVVSEVDAIVYHISRCWGFPDSDEASGPENKPVVEVRVFLLPDGSVDKARVVDARRMEIDPSFRAWAKSALRAIEDCGFPEMPKSKYTQWRDMVLRFDPQEYPPSKPEQAPSGTAEGSNALTAAEVEAVRDQFYRCWNALVGARDSEQLVVMLQVTFDPDGEVRQVEVLNRGSNPLTVELRLNIGPNGEVLDRKFLASDETTWDPFFRASAESAMRAVRRCSPIKPLARDYADWRQMTLVFDPRPLLSQ